LDGPLPQAGCGGGYSKATLGEADDVLDPNGERILGFAQAQEKARAWFEMMAREGRRPASQPYTGGGRGAARAYAAIGLTVRIIRPLDGFKDLNDELRGAQ
jgi:hypothetical protein